MAKYFWTELTLAERPEKEKIERDHLTRAEVYRDKETGKLYCFIVQQD